MTAGFTSFQIEQARAGDRVQYRGVDWWVVDYSTYTDRHGYETQEWLLRSQTGQDYYLLREVDPQNPTTLVHWYLAEELRQPSIFEPNSSDELSGSLWRDMKDDTTPYPALQVQNRTYYFESKTQGSYQGEEGETSRITWDYWDRSREWNLALEAWRDRSLRIYSTRAVDSEEFSVVGTPGGYPAPFLAESSNQVDRLPLEKILGACALIVVGILMMIFG
jgi:hypothetical protein